MSDLRDLYQEVILDHNRRPRNFGPMEGADRAIDGHNPLCGDKLTLFLRMEGDRIAEVSFVGRGLCHLEGVGVADDRRREGQDRRRSRRACSRPSTRW